MNIVFVSQSYKKALIVLCIAALGFAGNAIIGKLAVNEVSPIMIVFLRWGIVTCLLLLFRRKQFAAALPNIKNRFFWILMMGGVGLTTFNSLFYIAAQYTSAINIGIMQSTMPALVVLGTVIFYKSKVLMAQYFGLLLTILGVLVVVSKGQINTLFSLTGNIGDLIMLTGCMFYAGYNIGLRDRPPIDALTMMTFFSIAAWIISCPLLAIEYSLDATLWPTTNGWLIIFYVALIPSLLSQVLFMHGVDLIGPGQAALHLNLVPIFTAILGISILGEMLHVFHIASLLLVFLGIFAFRYTTKS